MISRDEMMTPILKASPGFVPIWSDFFEEWKNERDGLPIYLVLSDLARYIALLHTQGNDSEVKSIFSVIEKWHIEGDSYVREAATIGLLEDLQNTGLVGEGKPAEFLKYLGPVSKNWWFKVDEFWSKGEIISDD